MNSIVRLNILGIILSIVFVGCGASSVYNVMKSEIKHKVSQENVFNAIKKAGYSKGWVVKKVETGLAKAVLHYENSKAVVEIPHSSNTFSINHVSSVNLDHNKTKGTIHPKYNKWVQKFENAINHELKSIANKK